MIEEVPFTEILGVPVACTDVPQILDLVQKWSYAETRRTILYVNAYCLNIACKDAEYRALLNHADLVYSDGISVVWSSRWLGGCRMKKITGADWIDDFCRCAEQSRLRIYLLGGKPGIARLACHNLQKKYPALTIVGSCDGYFEDTTESEALQNIQATQPHVLFVGMGTPTQEKWIADHRESITAPVCWAIGALFDYIAGKEPRVPKWMNTLALEWLWRLLMDPLGKWQRYLIGNPLFIFRILRQKFKSGSGVTKIP